MPANVRATPPKLAGLVVSHALPAASLMPCFFPFAFCSFHEWRDCPGAEPVGPAQSAADAATDAHSTADPSPYAAAADAASSNGADANVR